MSHETCDICTKPLNAPYRVYSEQGKIIGGCVSKNHDGHLVAISDTSFWHNSKNAKEIRKQYKL